MAATTTESARQAINLRTLQRCDPTIRTILDSASYVVLYKYLGGKWTKEGIEGSLFVYERTTVPQHGLLVLNRNGMNNFIRHLTPGTELDIQGQIVHVSGGDEKHDGIYGLWFAGGEPEAQRLIDVMNQSINRASNDGGSGATDPTTASTNQVPTQPTMMDLLARLTVAPSTPPIQSRSPALASSQSAQQFQTQASPRPEPSRLTASVSDPSTSLKQLLGVMSPVQTSATPVRTGTPPRRAPPDSPSVSRPRAKKGDSGYIPSSERNVEPSDEGFDKGAARVAILGALKGGQAEARGIQSESIEPSKEGQRDFVRGLLNCIHTDKEFVEELYKDYLRNKGGGR
ncbi:hypothetical protein FFLO_03095 [Filobasidium floriforme]|uniref:Uncharacterized protein n=1 Tax=Filobasidium floriforme TaxID=5210 RepID=A0A8K0NNI0_9TREE|nr:uncharacterized protein HD553DRAFT_339118 [Filobasidium floriforme]KAG7548982.1 hypothetical protein FFLO_03095 [Filobasidium floriforme]KAH8089798.1 hypothetical protein HD553DRAFT_339118 [Filobasidium floriforme]